MALSRIQGITVTIGADTSELTKKLDSFERQTNGVANQLKDINKLLKLDPTNTTLLTQKQQELARQVEATKTQLKNEEEALRQLQQAPDSDKTIAKQEKLARQIEETKRKLKEAEQAYREFGSVGIQQAAAIGKKMEDLGDKMVSVGRNMTRYLTVPIVGAGTLAVKEYADFEQSMAQVGAVAQASGKKVVNAKGETVDALEGMSQYAREVAATTKFTAGEVTDAYYYMALAGWEPQESMEGLVGVLNLVAASGEDLGRVSDIVTDGLTAFQLSADDSTHFADVLAVAMSHTNTTVDQLGDAFKYVAPVAGAMGYKVEDVAVALGTMANNGIKGSTAGTTLRNILTNLAKPTDQMAVALDELGISLDDGRGNMYSFAEVMDQFRGSLGNIKIPMNEYQNALAQLDEELEEGSITEDQYADSVATLAERAYGAEGALMANYAATIAGKRGMAGLMAIVSSSDSDWNDLTNAIYGADGASEEMRKTMEDTLQGQFLILKSEVAELGIEFGEALLPTIRDVVAWLKGLVERFQALSPKTKETIARVLALVAAIGPLLVIGGNLIKGIGKFLELPLKIVSGVSKVITVLTSINPVVLAVIAGIAALIAAGVWLTHHWEDVKAVATRVWTGIKDFFTSVLTAIKNLFVSIWNGIKTALTTVWNGIKIAATVYFEAIKTYFTSVLTYYKTVFTNVWNGIKTIVLGVWNGIKTQAQIIWNGIKLMITNPVEGIKYIITNTFSNIKGTLSTMWSGIKGILTAPFEGAKAALQNIVNRIKGFFPINISNMLSKIKLPHINVSWRNVGPVKIPSLSISWYKKAYENGMRFASPTVLPTASGLSGFGDGNGAEWVVGENSLMNMVSRAASNSVNTEAIYDAVYRGASNSQPIIIIDGKKMTAVVNNHNTSQQISNMRFMGAY